MQILDTTLDVPVIDAKTGYIRKDVGIRAVRNPAWSAFYPGAPISVIDWEGEFKRVTKDVNRLKSHSEDSRKLIIERMEELLHVPVTYHGVGPDTVVLNQWDTHKDWVGTQFRGDWASGSMAKRYMSVGLTSDVLVETGLAKKAEDQVRFVRSFLPNARYGAALLDRPKILVLPEGTVFNGYLVEDGCHCVRRGLVLDIRNGQRMRDPLVHLGESRQNYMIWQRFRWQNIAEEAIPEIVGAIFLAEHTTTWIRRALGDVGQRQQLIELNPKFLHHPYFSQALARSVKETLIELATTVPLPCRYYTAAPSRTGEWILPKGRWMVGRWPDDSWNGVQGIEVLSGDTEEIAWTQKQAIAQASITALDWAVKGNQWVVPDELMDGYDIVLCSEDIKMMSVGDVGSFRKAVADKGSAELTSAGPVYYGILQIWGHGSILAIPQHYQVEEEGKLVDRGFKFQGGDKDGDGVVVTELTDYPAIWDELRSRKWQGSAKTEKTHSSLLKRARMIVESMGNNIGIATTFNGDTFAMGPDSRTELVAPAAGFNSEEDLDLKINFFMKTFSDFKSLNDTVFLVKSLQKLITLVLRVIGRQPGHISWARNKWAFVHGIPGFEEELSPTIKDALAMGGKAAADAKKEDEYRAHISWAHVGCTITQIFLVARPFLLDMWNKAKDKGGHPLVDQLKVAPLSDFASLVPQVSDEQLEFALEWQQEYYRLHSSVVWIDSKEDGSASRFKPLWREMAMKYADAFVEKFGLPTVEETKTVEETFEAGNVPMPDPKYLNAVYALWRASHMSGGDYAGGGSVLLGFPEYCLWIAANEPGLMTLEDVKTEVVGLQYNFWTVPSKVEGASVHIHSVEYQGQTRRVVVSLNPAEWKGLKIVDGGILPKGLVGFIPPMKQRQLLAGFSSPPDGVYLANAELAPSGSAYIMFLRRAG